MGKGKHYFGKMPHFPQVFCRNRWQLKKTSYICTDYASPLSDKGGSRHRWNPKAENTICKDSQRERTFSERYLSVQSNLANLNLSTAVMQRSVRVGVLYPGCSLLSLLFGGYVYAELYNITRRGLACVAYPWKEAMREPDCRDRRGGINSHVFFISILEISNLC